MWQKETNKSRWFGRQTCLESVCFINDERQSEKRYAVTLGESMRGVLDPIQEEKKGVTVLETLKSKHPEPHKSRLSSQLQVPVLSNFEDVIISSASIEKTTRSLQGSSGASKTDSEHWQMVLLRHGAHRSHLRDEVATLATKMCNRTLPWSKVRVLVSGRLIALHKCPGVRPIGIGECLRRIMWPWRNMFDWSISLWAESWRWKLALKEGPAFG